MLNKFKFPKHPLNYFYYRQVVSTYLCYWILDIRLDTILDTYLVLNVLHILRSNLPMELKKLYFIYDSHITVNIACKKKNSHYLDKILHSRCLVEYLVYLCMLTIFCAYIYFSWINIKVIDLGTYYRMIWEIKF